MCDTPTVSQLVPFPKKTEDYIIKCSKYGLGLYANRDIAKGEQIFEDSIEFTFSDVQDGDCLLLDSTLTASTQSREGKVPSRFPLSRDTLNKTHGVPQLYPDPTGQFSGIVSMVLEVPHMLMNHSSDPNAMKSSNCAATGEDIAMRDIKKGEELTVNYFLEYYDSGPFFDECRCDSSNCSGQMNGFKSLNDEDKERLLPLATDAVQAMHRADIGECLPVKHEQVSVPQRVPSLDNKTVPRLVYPGPSHALSKVAVRRQDNDSEKLSLYALKDFNFGEKVYEFWCQDWYLGGKVAIDMVFAVAHLEGDPAEGTVVRLSQATGSQNRDGTWMCSGYDCLTTHSCEPNIMYRHTRAEEGESWRRAFAAKDIKAGDMLTVDVNCNLWDCSEYMSSDCSDDATKCTDTKKGFKFLSNEAQEERKMMSWRRVSPPYDGEGEVKKLGMALSLRIQDQLGMTNLSCSSSSSSSSSDSDSD